MAKTFEAPFTQSRKVSTAVATAAKTTYNDAAGAVQLFQAGADGGVLRRVTAIMRGTVTATQLQLYRSLDGGATLTLWRTKLMPAYTMSQTTEAPITDMGLDFDAVTGLAPNERIYCAIGVALAAGVVFTAEGEDY